MTSKNQGEGDYEAARRYDKRTRKFVEENKGGQKLKGSAKDAQPELTDAEREALKHAKTGEQDRKDADLLRDLESRRS